MNGYTLTLTAFLLIGGSLDGLGRYLDEAWRAGLAAFAPSALAQAS